MAAPLPGQLRCLTAKADAFGLAVGELPRACRAIEGRCGSTAVTCDQAAGTLTIRYDTTLVAPVVILEALAECVPGGAAERQRKWGGGRLRYRRAQRVPAGSRRLAMMSFAVARTLLHGLAHAL